MSMYYNCKLKYEMTTEDGSSKKVTDSFIVEGVSFADAEHRVSEFAQSYVGDGFAVNAVSKVKISEIFRDEDGHWYNCKVVMTTLDEKSGKEKKNNLTMYVQGWDIPGVIKSICSNMRGTISDYKVVSVSLTNVVEIIKA